MERGTLQKSISDTIAYFQVFNYFLKVEELEIYLHSENVVSKQEIINELLKEKRLINNYAIFLSEENQKTRKRKRLRQKKIKIQEKKFVESEKKIILAKKITSILKLIPSIKLIAVSGNLAMMNADKSDDIDLFLIASSGTAWTTRLIASLFLIALGKKRMFNDKKVKNKICLNFILDEDNLCLVKKNLYSAHEVAQMKIIFDKNKTYDKFLRENYWLKNHLANFWAAQDFSMQETLFSEEESEIEKITSHIFRLFEPLTRFLQFQYMKRKITKETVKKGIMMFHPRDYGKEIMAKYKRMIRNSVGR